MRITQRALKPEKKIKHRFGILNVLLGILLYKFCRIFLMKTKVIFV
jgi:hypothetical protein